MVILYACSLCLFWLTKKFQMLLIPIWISLSELFEHSLLGEILIILLKQPSKPLLGLFDKQQSMTDADLGLCQGLVSLKLDFDFCTKIMRLDFIDYITIT